MKNVCIIHLMIGIIVERGSAFATIGDRFRLSDFRAGWVVNLTMWCEYLDVTLAREDWAESRAHKLVQWGLKWCDQLRGVCQLPHTLVSERTGERESSDTTLVSGDGQGTGAVLLSIQLSLFLTIIINMNTIMLTWGLENTQKCKQYLQSSDQSSSCN